MRISTLGYIGKQGVKNIGRNKMFSIASIATMSACIFLFGLFFSIVLNLQHFVRLQRKAWRLQYFLMRMQQKVRSRRLARSFAADDVLKVEYVSEDDAWNSFKEEYFGDNPELADGFKDDNPLAGSSSYAVYMKPQEDKGQQYDLQEQITFCNTEGTGKVCGRDWTESERSINQMLWRIHFPVSMYWLDMCQSRSF